LLFSQWKPLFLGEWNKKRDRFLMEAAPVITHEDDLGMD
jgi:hypothetical protein